MQLSNSTDHSQQQNNIDGRLKMCVFISSRLPDKQTGDQQDSYGQVNENRMQVTDKFWYG